MAFLAQIDLAELHAAQGPDWLPACGLLFFFYDDREGSWGFSPDDRGSWAVIHDVAAPDTAREPGTPQPAPLASFPGQSITMRPHLSLPTPERLEIDTLHMDDAEHEALYALLDARDGDLPLHQIGGWPHPIQNDHMELECQLASNGIDCGDPDAFRSERAKALASDAGTWRLLLQLDSDDASEMMWGDSGILYFWVREADARAGDFSKAWMILQCC